MTNRRQAGRVSSGSLPTGLGKPQTQVARAVDWVAPVGGWRTDVTLVEMPPTAAATLVNFFPETGFVRARNGSQPWLTPPEGIPSEIQVPAMGTWLVGGSTTINMVLPNTFGILPGWTIVDVAQGKPLGTVLTYVGTVLTLALAPLVSSLTANDLLVFTSPIPALSAAVQTLMPYSGLAQQLFAVAGVGIFDATKAGVAGTPVFMVTNAYLSFANFTNAAGHWLVCVNGADPPFLYNGATWAPTVITGPTDPTKLFVVANYRERLWFLEAGTTSLWFLPTDGITGAAQAVNLGDVLRFGGLPIAINTWTMQVANVGVQQMLCILTTEGELVIYTGSDPTNASNFALLGTFKLGYPLGLDRSMYQVGGDLAIMTVDGIVAASQAIALDPAATDQSSMTKAIAPTWLSTVQSVGRNTVGWQFITYPGRRMVIVNVPDPTVGTYQYVMNAEALTWTLFSGMPSTSWAVLEGNLFFGTASSGVWQADVGSTDNGAPIDCLSVGAWNRLSDGLAPKSTTLIGVDCIVDGNVSLFAGASFDYVNKVPSALGVTGVTIGSSLWDIGLWDEAQWPGLRPLRLIADASGEGVVFAPTIRALINGGPFISSNCQILGGTIHVQSGAGI